MALLDIITLPDAKLRLVSEPVERIDDELLRFMDDMLETMYEAPGIGLAAIQVGVPRRVVTIDGPRGGQQARAAVPDQSGDPDLVRRSLGL